MDARLRDGVADPKVSTVLQSAQEVLNVMMAAVAGQPDTSINGVSVRRKTTAYSRRHVVGRLSAVRASFMYLPNVFRQTLGRGYLRDFDFMRSYQKVAVGLLLLAGATPGEELVAYAEGSDLVDQIVQYYGFYHKPKECAKVMIQVAFFNGDLSYAVRKLHGFYGHPMPTLVQLQAQCLRAREIILAMPGFEHAIPKLHKSVRRQKPGRTEEQYLRSVFSHVLGGVEGHCLAVACRELDKHGFAVCTYVYDGAITTDSANSTPAEACAAADAAVLAETGVRMTIREKPMFGCGEIDLDAESIDEFASSVLEL